MFAAIIGITLTALPSLSEGLIGLRLGVGLDLIGILLSRPILEFLGMDSRAPDSLFRAMAYAIAILVNVITWAAFTFMCSRFVSAIPRRAIGYGISGGVLITVGWWIWRIEILKLAGVFAAWMMFGMNGTGNTFCDDYIAPAFAIVANVVLWAIPISIWMLPIVGVPRRNENEKE